MVIKYTKCYNRTMKAMYIQFESPTPRSIKYKQEKNKKVLTLISFNNFITNGPGACPASSVVGVGSFPGIEQLDYGINHSPSSRAEVQE